MQQKAGVVKALEILGWIVIIAGIISGIVVSFNVSAVLGVQNMLISIIGGTIMLALAYIANSLNLRAPRYGTKVCPDCAESIRMGAMICKFCGHKFDRNELVSAATTKLKSNNAADVFEAVQVLRESGAKSAVPFLLEKFENSAYHATYFRNLAETIVELGDDTIVSKLIELSEREREMGGGMFYRDTAMNMAEHLAKAALEKNPNNSNAHNSLGKVYGRQGQNEQAVQEFAKAIEIDSKFAEAFYNLGVVYQKIKKYTEAIEAYKQYVKLNPKGEDAEEVKKTIEQLENIAR